MFIFFAAVHRCMLFAIAPSGLDAVAFTPDCPEPRTLLTVAYHVSRPARLWDLETENLSIFFFFGCSIDHTTQSGPLE